MLTIILGFVVIDLMQLIALSFRISAVPNAVTLCAQAQLNGVTSWLRDAISAFGIQRENDWLSGSVFDVARRADAWQRGRHPA